MGMFSVYWISICLKIRKYTQYTLLQRKIDQNDYFLLSYHYSKIREHRDKKSNCCRRFCEGYSTFELTGLKAELLYPSQKAVEKTVAGTQGPGLPSTPSGCNHVTTCENILCFLCNFIKHPFSWVLLSVMSVSTIPKVPNGPIGALWQTGTDGRYVWYDIWEIWQIWQIGDMTNRIDGRYDIWEIWLIGNMTVWAWQIYERKDICQIGDMTDRTGRRYDRQDR